MVLEIHVAGPGLDVTRRIAAGDEQLVLGRDPECDVCLPDPARTVSRRHLALWNEGGELHFHVVSSVNGIEMPFGEAPPGARGVLPGGESLKVGDYVVNAARLESPAPAPAAAEPDPWAVFDRDGSGIAPAMPVAAPPSEDDPFSDWGFNTTFGPPDAPGGGLQAGSFEVGDLSSFFRGLGVEPGTIGAAARRVTRGR